MPIEARALRSFALQDDPSEGKGPRGRLLAAVAASGFTVEYILEPQKKLTPATELARGERFGLFLKPGPDARILFGLDREVLLWCSTFPTFQARDISDLTSAIEDHGVRLSRQFAILATRYEVESRSNFEGEAALDTTLVHVSLKTLVDDGLNATLSNRLYARDLYDLAGAVVRSADFYGRRALLDSLIGEIETGSSQIGVFGLRKVGKTSLLNRLADRLKVSGRCVVARLDLQWTTSVNASPEYTLWSLGEALFGTPCLVMELLRGATLADLCNAATRPERRELLRLMREVLEALAYLHPKQSQVEALQSKEVLSGAELDAWDRARHGYVHRDIKARKHHEGRGPRCCAYRLQHQCSGGRARANSLGNARLRGCHTRSLVAANGPTCLWRNLRRVGCWRKASLGRHPGGLVDGG